MFKNKLINSSASDKANVQYDPDSSPAAWQHYKKFYSSNKYLREHYNFDELFFYNKYDTVGLKAGYFNSDNGKWYNYVNKPKPGYNRKYVLEKEAKIKTVKDTEFIMPANRLGGDCDFNFNEKKCDAFRALIDNDVASNQEEKKKARKQLEHCRNMHHTLINFSLMQAIGNLQEFKGSNRFDRLDTFIYELDKYYRGISNAILQSSSPNNKPALISFLNDFKDIYEYCATFYFITDKQFINEIINQGSKPIRNTIELITYMDLAEKFWIKKNLNF